MTISTFLEITRQFFDFMYYQLIEDEIEIYDEENILFFKI